MKRYSIYNIQICKRKNSKYSKLECAKLKVVNMVKFDITFKLWLILI